MKRKRGRPKGSTKKSLLHCSEDKPGPDPLSTETKDKREQEARPEEKESQGWSSARRFTTECHLPYCFHAVAYMYMYMYIIVL